MWSARSRHVVDFSHQNIFYVSSHFSEGVSGVEGCSPQDSFADSRDHGVIRADPVRNCRPVRCPIPDTAKLTMHVVF